MELTEDVEPEALPGARADERGGLCRHERRAAAYDRRRGSQRWVDEIEGLTSDELTMEDELAIEEIPVEEMDDLDASLAEMDAETPAATEGLPLIETDPSVDLTELENQVLDDPENPDLHRLLAEHLLDQNDLMRGIEELDLALMSYERLEELARRSRSR